MKKFWLLLPLLLISPFIYASVDEYKTDIYFSNGILTEEGDAQYYAQEVLKKNIRTELYSKSEVDMNKHIGKVDYAYNSTHGFGLGFLEAALQKVSTGRVVPDKSSILL